MYIMKINNEGKFANGYEELEATEPFAITAKKLEEIEAQKRGANVTTNQIPTKNIAEDPLTMEQMLANRNDEDGKYDARKDTGYVVPDNNNNSEAA
jgi:hypothetical protein